ncbi:MAG: 50S ribosomal protein L6 [Candidatus Magasanikbacteria bacterium GW2011_GWA2_50_22]|uniref:Large ribosomal subunit protein uL6 n=1 Tax=Candidatus Magasanikbacteria bacterium GW2011_GWA2_50_22 TaxID=1619043 RepID=A0A0G1ZEI2_9BACT|nr:MAG: 50S ribosomal protein L6 [Candidatus Magasanikbacteria bacterium GW2011_GWA2_50_22]
MSRIGKKIRILPAGVTAEMKGTELMVKGPKGELKLSVHPRVTVVISDSEVTVQVAGESQRDRALWGTFSSLIENMIDGVVGGFKKQLEINGVGFKAALKGGNLSLEVGFSHPVEVKPLPGTKFSVEKNVITVEGTDKQAVGEMAAIIRRVRKPEPYKGKGIKYMEEIVRRKAGKTAAKTAA